MIKKKDQKGGYPVTGITVQYQPSRLTATDSTGKQIAYVSFPQIRRCLVNIDRLHVIPEYRHSGAEEVLMDALLAHLVQQGAKAVLTCPAAQRYVAEHPQWKQVLPESMRMTSP